MASKTAILSVRIISDGKDAAAGFKSTEQAAREFESSLNTASVAAGVTLAAITAAGAGAVSAASDLQQSGGAMAAVFGQHAEEIGQLADGAARRVGLAQSEYQQLAAVLGAQMKNLGIDEADLVGQTDELITMGADLAAVFNGSTSEAVSALSALMRGERDPIERYGVTIKQAAVDAKVAEMGLDGLEGQAKTTAEAHATLALLAEQTGHAHGQFASEMDTAAVSSQVAAALWKDAAADLGTALLPLVAEGANLLAGLAEGFSQNSEILVPLVLIVGGFVAVLAALVLGVKAYRTAAEVAAAAQVIWNAAMSANPIGLIIIAIAALIGFIILIGTNWEEVKVIWADALASMVGWIEDLINWIIDAINWLGQFFGMTDGLSNVDWGLDRGSASAYVLAGDTGPQLAQTFALRAFNAPPALPAALTAPALGAAGSPQVINQYDVTVTGALDAEAVGRQIRKILSDLGAASGTVRAGGARWQPTNQ
ncbi:hypothetical protein [Leucobacter ruminantium]|uniref:Uncharacterized protein n=1 Tax=Leucobacter ruminantium TaxID=1289170 RepID=A0A939RXA6_9MICO|nr:hypothetical protein [Leucobacter ruminantium]MBO1805897.1 hypothetical protein [Leucobacter ruminantium]